MQDTTIEAPSPAGSGGQAATPPKKWKPPEAADYLGVSEKTLRKWRMLGTGPKYYRCGTRGGIRYDVNDLNSFLEVSQ
jgi:hypothetical protein